MSLNPTAITQAITPTPMEDGFSSNVDSFLRQLPEPMKTWVLGTNFVAGAGLGTSPAIIISPNFTCNDQGGSFDVTVGGTPATGTIITCTFVNLIPAPRLPRIDVFFMTGAGFQTPPNTQLIFADSILATGFNIISAGVALTTAVAYRIVYQVFA